jgi:glycosyltransferase involved in cell wall biosynthesis
LLENLHSPRCSPLRIAQVAPARAPVRCESSEGVEQLVWLLCEELVARGHEVTLFAAGDSETSAELRCFFERGYESSSELWDWQYAEYMHVGHAYSQADQFDVIHCHSCHFGLPFASLVRTPDVHSHHIPAERSVVGAYRRLDRVEVVVASRYRASAYGDLPRLEVIPYGVETAALPFFSRRGDYLLFLGGMTAGVGAAWAIEIARAAEMPLVVAGPARAGFDAKVARQIDGRGVSYVGRVRPRERHQLLAGAAALLCSFQPAELFMSEPIEAMGCGTPVLGVENGALQELIEPGLTGYLAPSWEGIPALVPRALELNRRTIRQRAMERFDLRQMVDRHEALYRRLAFSRAGAVSGVGGGRISAPIRMRRDLAHGGNGRASGAQRGAQGR